MTKCKQLASRQDFSESTGRLSGAYQRPGLSGEDDVPRRKFYGHPTLMVFFPWFLDTFEWAWDLRSSIFFHELL